MSEAVPVKDARPPSSAAPVVCPVWCRGCGPNDPMHRGLLATIGRERTGWVSVQLLVDRFARRDLASSSTRPATTRLRPCCCRRHR